MSRRLFAALRAPDLSAHWALGASTRQRVEHLEPSGRRCRCSRASLTALALLCAVTGCSGRSCDDLPRLRAERDVARADYLELVRSGTASSDETEQADEQLHAVERRVHAAEQGCEDR